MTLGREGLLTAYDLTEVGLLAGVKPHVRLQISFFEERLAAVVERADKVTFAFMFLNVHLQALDATVRLTAVREGADVLFVFKVSGGVVFEVASGHERFAAFTGERTVVLHVNSNQLTWIFWWLMRQLTASKVLRHLAK